MASLSLQQILTLLKGAHIPPASHKVLINGEEKGTCTKASFRSVLTLHGIEFPVDYAYELDGTAVSLSSRVNTKGLGAGGHETIKVDGKDVSDDDVLVGFEVKEALSPSLYVEFRYTKDGQKTSVKFVAPLPETKN